MYAASSIHLCGAFFLRRLKKMICCRPLHGIILVLLTLTSCTVITRNATPTYVALAPNASTLTEAGSAEASLAGYLTRIGGQVAVVPLNHIVLTAQGQYSSSDKRRDRFRTGEISLGYTRWRSDHIFLGLYGGVGAGNGHSTGYRYETRSGGLFLSNGGSYDSSDRHAVARYRSFFVMPIIGIRTPDRRLEWTGSAKLNFVHYDALHYKIQHQATNTYGTTRTSSDTFTGIWRAHGQLAGTINHSLTPHLWLLYQLGAEFDLQPDNLHYRFSPLVLAVGLRLRLGHTPPFASNRPKPTAP